MSISKAIYFGFFFYGWIKRASKDGEISAAEKLELMTVAAEIFDIKELKNINASV